MGPVEGNVISTLRCLVTSIFHVSLMVFQKHLVLVRKRALRDCRCVLIGAYGKVCSFDVWVHNAAVRSLKKTT